MSNSQRIHLKCLHDRVAHLEVEFDKGRKKGVKTIVVNSPASQNLCLTIIWCLGCSWTIVSINQFTFVCLRL